MQSDIDRKKSDKMSLRDKSYFWLKNQIVTNALPNGTLIDDAEIARSLGFSRTPLREAIRLLHSQGYLEVQPRKATRVASIQVSDMRYIYQLITALEVQAVALLATSQKGEFHIAPLRQAVAAMRKAEIGNLDEWHVVDERFHRGLVELCGNPWIARVAIEHRDFIQRAHLVALHLRTMSKRSAEVHGELVDLIAEGNVAGAVANHLDQRNRMETDLISAVERSGLKAL